MNKRGQDRSFSLCNFSPKNHKGQRPTISSRRNRRGLSTIIVTLILIVISLVAVAIFWVVVRNLISQQSEGISFEKFAISMDIKKVYSPGANDVAVTVQRNPGKAELSGINFIFYNDSDSEIVSQTIPIGELETKTFTLTLQNLSAASVTKVSVAPVFKANSEIGSIVASYQLTGPMESGSYVCTSNTCSALGYNCGTHVNGTCSGNIDCGTCGTGQTCISGTCQAGACAPATCSTLGYNCGTHNNGTCSGTLNCGNCSSGYNCVSGTCQAGVCSPKLSCNSGQCGSWANGTCSGTWNCGTCPSGQSCNVSGYCTGTSCTPKLSCNTGECGSWANGTCSGTWNCGTCSGGQTCVSGTCQATSGLCTGLKLLMHFDSSTSPTPDSSGNGNNGAVTGATWTSSGKFGGAFSYDGSNDYINIPSSSSLNLTSKTILLWAKRNQLSGTDTLFTDEAYRQNYFYLSELIINYVDGSNSEATTNFLSASGVANTWTQYVITYNINTPNVNISFYRDGSLRGSNTYSTGFTPYPAIARIGAFYYGDFAMNGTIDEVAVWNRTLTVSEISNLYSSGSAINC